MKKEPLVSVIIPTYNRAHLIGETLDSVLAQTYQNWECIIVDDGSSDHTDEVVGEYVKKDSRFKYYHRPDEHLPGGNGARNYGFKMSQGEYANFLDSDDKLANTCLSKRIEFVKKHNFNFHALISQTLCYTYKKGDSNILWNKIDSNETHIQSMIRFLNIDMPWHTNGVTWDKTFLAQIGAWDENLSAWQDWELHFRALSYKPNLIYNLGAPDNYFKIGDNHFSISKNHKNIKFINSIEKVLDNSAKLILQLNSEDFKVLKPPYDRLVLKMLIKFPMKHYNIFYPIKSIMKTNKFKITSFYNYIFTYLIFILCRSYKIKNFLFESVYNKKNKSLMTENTYLKTKLYKSL